MLSPKPLTPLSPNWGTKYVLTAVYSESNEVGLSPGYTSREFFNDLEFANDRWNTLRNLMPSGNFTSVRLQEYNYSRGGYQDFRIIFLDEHNDIQTIIGDK